jgi:hypothetical protein
MDRDAGSAGRIEGTGGAACGSDTVLKNFERGAGTAQDERAKREPRFHECGIDGQILRVRDAVLSLAVMAERAHSQASEANRIAKVHDHGSGGQVVVPIDNGANYPLSQIGDVETPFRRINRLLG